MLKKGTKTWLYQMDPVSSASSSSRCSDYPVIARQTILGAPKPSVLSLYMTNNYILMLILLLTLFLPDAWSLYQREQWVHR